MNCYNHNEKVGVAVCVNCGAVICVDCVKKTSANKIVCSEQCAEASVVEDSVIEMMAARVKRTSKANAWFCWALGTVFAAYGLIVLPDGLFFAAYFLAASVVLFGTGFWFKNIEQK